MASILRPLSLPLSKIIVWKNFYFHQILRKNSHIDKIDCFANDIVRVKALKWKKFQKSFDKTENLNRKISMDFLVKGVLQDIKNIDSLQSIELNIATLTNLQVKSLIVATIRSDNHEDFYYLMKECLKAKKLPDLDNSLTFLSSRGDTKTITALGNLYTELFQTRNLVFLPYIGYAYWKRGNVNFAIESFNKFYESSEKANKKEIYRIFKFIANETFNDKGEAVLHALVSFAKKLHIKFGDIFFLGCIWNESFKSDWFSDQNLSVEIFDENEEIRHAVEKGSLNLCFCFLNNNNTDAVYRLIELFLKYDMKNGYEECLKSLFDYYYRHQNIRACMEIMKFFETLDIEAPSSFNKKLLNLWLNNFNFNSKIGDQPKFQYKF